MEELLAQADVTEEQYAESIKVSQKGNNIVLARRPCETMINGYNNHTLGRSSRQYKKIVHARSVCIGIAYSKIRRGRKCLSNQWLIR